MTTLMSKGPGRIERSIEAAFRSNPDGYFSVHDLARIAYPGEVYGHIERSKRAAILRAAPKVAKSLHWVAFRSTAMHRGAEVIFANGLSLRSYGLGKVRAHLPFSSVYEYSRRPDGKAVRRHLLSPKEHIVDRLETDEYYIKRMAPGGEFVRAVEYHTAVAGGDTERAAELGAAIERTHEADLRPMRAMLKSL
jgi:hypothetical protein